MALGKMQPDILIATAGIIVTFMLGIWRLIVSQNKRLDRFALEFRGDNSKLRDEFRGDNSKLRDEFRDANSKLRDEFRDANSKLRDEFGQQISELRDDNNKLRDEFRDANSKLRDEFRDELRDLRKDVNQLDRRLSHQQALIQALWSRSFREDEMTSAPALQE